MISVFLEYANESNEISPVYDDCPVFCFAHNKPALNYCRNCPVGIAKAHFRRDAIALLNERLPGRTPGAPARWEKYGFDYLYKTVLQILELETLPLEKQTVVTTRLIQILQSERNRALRIDRWNKSQNTNT